MRTLSKDKMQVGWDWLVAFDWTNVTRVQSLWFGNQIERFIVKFGLTEDDGKRLRAEISAKGMK